MCFASNEVTTPTPEDNRSRAICGVVVAVLLIFALIGMFS